LIVGQWDTITQAGGSNTEIYGLYKTSRGIICVGKQLADSSGIPIGNNLPVTNSVAWSNSIPQNESAVLAYYQSPNLFNMGDDITLSIPTLSNNKAENEFRIFPSPADQSISVRFSTTDRTYSEFTITDPLGRLIFRGTWNYSPLNVSALSNGIYFLSLISGNKRSVSKFLISR
jgi:hypothetical protein